MRPPLPHEGALTRRALLWTAVPLAFVQHAAPGQASTDPLAIAGQIRGKGDAISVLGQPWSTDCAWAVQPPVLASELLLPNWFVGRWRVKGKLEGVSFPLGRRFVTELTPGARMASILPLPNVGNAPNFELTFVAADGGGGGAARPLRGENARRLFEAFWPDASVLSANEGGLDERGRLQLTYEAPTRTQAKVQQSIDARTCAAEGGALSEDEYVSAEVVQQANLEQGFRSQYLILQSYRRDPANAGVVRSKQRVAAFLQPTDGPRYFDAAGKPVALFDYTYTLTRDE